MFMKLKNIIFLILRFLYSIIGKTSYASYISQNQSNSDNGMYLGFVKRATFNEKVFKNFRSNIWWKNVVENTRLSEALEYEKSVIANKPSDKLIENFSKNDLVGNPKKYYFKNLKSELAPNTIRYIKVAYDLKKLIDNFGIKNPNVIEIGVGCGGQVLILDKLLEINNYTLVDLKDVLLLTEKFVNNFVLNTKLIYRTLNEIGKHDSFDFVISNYAFSELPKKLQSKYMEKIILKSKHGYMTMNTGGEESYDNSLDHITQKELLKSLKGSKLSYEPFDSKSIYIIQW